MHSLSCARWVESPYFQYFTGETFFQHAFAHERSGLSHWRKRLGDKLDILLQESLRVAHINDLIEPRPEHVARPVCLRLLRSHREPSSMRGKNHKSAIL